MRLLPETISFSSTGSGDTSKGGCLPLTQVPLFAESFALEISGPVVPHDDPFEWLLCHKGRRLRLGRLGGSFRFLDNEELKVLLFVKIIMGNQSI